MSSRLLRVFGLVAALTIGAAGFGSAHGVVTAADKAVDGLGLQPAVVANIDDATMRADSARIDRADRPRKALERVLLTSADPSLQLPRSFTTAVIAHPTHDPALLPMSPSLGRAPPVTQ